MAEQYKAGLPTDPAKLEVIAQASGIPFERLESAAAGKTELTATESTDLAAVKGEALMYLSPDLREGR